MNFIEDDEKMRDFFLLTKEEFLKSYSYLSEDDYNATKELVENKKIIEIVYKGEDNDNRPVYVSNGGYIYKDISLGKSTNLKSSLYHLNINYDF